MSDLEVATTTGAQIAETDKWVLIIKPDLPMCQSAGVSYEHGEACTDRPMFFELTIHSCEGGRLVEEIGDPEPPLALRMRWEWDALHDDTEILLRDGGWHSLGEGKVRFVEEPQEEA